ncbi:uncharacterized protein NEPG_01014 [Nematocida parisii ERTm1]|uniref:uncharacterized protein n=1 Tax=Nematocida parisii (strain ERTm1 / ATCC PRA-289) TaxID=881290 RepID=UPI000264B1FB|nr:uncharacterized protein NEPG_01014 [Nematocida parisii ERTm1]EIJ94346.1 hypothetical protein NEPG_01014 [Nematocida parisii ERTm1]|eukprot:XP_013058842.1 hypothetical protein NEPG_01014 [Nematocida parisii ERTm1]
MKDINNILFKIVVTPPLRRIALRAHVCAPARVVILPKQRPGSLNQYINFRLFNRRSSPKNWRKTQGSIDGLTSALGLTQLHPRLRVRAGLGRFLKAIKSSPLSLSSLSWLRSRAAVSLFLVSTLKINHV